MLSGRCWWILGAGDRCGRGGEAGLGFASVDGLMLGGGRVGVAVFVVSRHGWGLGYDGGGEGEVLNVVLVVVVAVVLVRAHSSIAGLRR